MKNSPTLCVTCHFAPWARGVESCVIHIRIQTLSYNDSEVANKNRAGVGQECFPGLPTDGAYTVYIVVYDDDERHIAAVYNHTLIDFTSSHPPVNNAANDDNNNSLWKILLGSSPVIFLGAGALIGLAVCLIYRV